MFTKSLVINDDPLSVMITRKMIDISGFSKEVIAAENGEDALRQLETFVSGSNTSDVPEFIFLDLYMPVMDGWAFLEAFSRRYTDILPNIKVAITSAFLTDEEVARLENYQMVIGYFPAPLCLDKLADMKQKLRGYFHKYEAVA